MTDKQYGESPVIIREEGSVGIVQTNYHTFAHPPDTFLMDNGSTLNDITVAYETYGVLNNSKDNAVLIEHALTASAHAAGRHHTDDKYPGWWDVMIGPGKAFDTNKYFVVCSNILGGCYGTTGPSSTDPDTGKPYGMRFPVTTISDMVRVQKELVEHLGIKRLRTIAGGSMGGMQALEWALLYPEMVDSIILIATAARSSPQSIAIHKVGTQAIVHDPNWQDGDYYDGTPPANGLAIARMLGHITYLSDDWLWEKFGREHKDPENMKLEIDSNFEIENYLVHQGRKFIDRFDPNSYLYIMRAIDIYDASWGYESLVESFARIKCKRVCVKSFSADWLYPSYQSREIVDAMLANDIDVEYREINSPYGHDSFLLEYEALTPSIVDFIESLT